MRPFEHLGIQNCVLNKTLENIAILSQPRMAVVIQSSLLDANNGKSF